MRDWLARLEGPLAQPGCRSWKWVSPMRRCWPASAASWVAKGRTLKDGGRLAKRSNTLLAAPMARMAEQFSAMGHAGKADALLLRREAAAHASPVGCGLDDGATCATLRLAKRGRYSDA